MATLGATLARNLAALRNLRKLSQGQLAKKVGVSEQTIWNLENRKRAASLDILSKLAKALGVEETDLVFPGQPPEAVVIQPTLIEAWQMVGNSLKTLPSKASPSKEGAVGKKEMKLPKTFRNPSVVVLGPLASSDPNRPKSNLPRILGRVAAGHPKGSDLSVEEGVHLDEYLAKNPESSVLVQVEGDSMREAGIHSGDLLVVDRSVQPRDGHIVIAELGDELTVKRVRKIRNLLQLAPANSDYEPIPIEGRTDFHIWGVVVSVIHSLPR